MRATLPPIDSAEHTPDEIGDERHGIGGRSARVVDAEPSPLRVIAHPAFSHRGVNPYTALLYAPMRAVGTIVDEYSGRRLLRGRYDVLHVHWPEGHLNDRSFVRAVRRSITKLAVMRLARSRGTKVIWTVHNLHSHERTHPRLERWFRRRFLRSIDGYISLTARGHVDALTRHPGLGQVPGFVIPAGHYRDAYAPAADRHVARERLGIAPDGHVIGFIGLIRPYKNVPALIEAFRALAADDLVLLVAGEPSDAPMADELRAAAGGDARIHLHLHWIDEAELALYAAAADLVVLPYRDILNSGSALLALSFDRPIMVPAIGGLAEVRDVVGESWVRTYDGALSPELLSSAVEWATSADRAPRAPLDELDWTRIATATLAAYRFVMRGSGVRP